MRAAAFLLLGLLLLAPTAAACEGLSPGDNVVSEGASCTLAFLVADPTGLYFMTAGHCIAEGATATNPDHGPIGTGAFTHLAGSSANGEGSPGEDFALIRIDPALYGDLNPKVCAWEGPTGVFDEDANGGEVRHHGYGMILGDVPQTRARSGHNLQYTAGSDVFRWLGAGVPGDSGSAVIHADGRALGVLTHLGAGATTNSGTSMARAFALAEGAGYDLRLVLMGEDPLAVLQEVRGGAPMVISDPAGAPEEPAAEPDTNATPAGGNTTKPAPSNGTAPSASPPPRDEPLDTALAADAGDNETPFAGPALAILAALGVAALRRR